MYATGMKRFIGIDIAETREKGLVEKSRFDHPIGGTKQIHELCCRNFQGFGSQVAQSGLSPYLPVGEKAQAPEPSIIVESQVHAFQAVTAGPEIEHHQVVFANGSLAVEVMEMSGHFQVYPQGDLARERDKYVLAAPLDGAYAPSYESPGKRAGP